MGDVARLAGDLPLFSSSLVNQQTSEHGRRKRRGCACETAKRASGPPWPMADREAYRVQPAAPAERAFRHSGWERDRARVRAAMAASGVRAGRLERFDECGANAIVEWSQTAQRHRIRANYCGDRFCLPCSIARSQRVTGELLRRVGDRDVLKIELTIRGEDRPLRESLDHLVASFKRLRRTDAFKKWIKAGAAFIEVKRGARSGQWHPHLHIIADGGFIEQKRLSSLWAEATGGSNVVWVSRVPADDDRLRYACKYAGKGWTREVAADHDSLVECVVALRGRRLVILFGGWYRSEEAVDAPTVADWVRVDRLERVLDAVGRGESWAVGVFVSLGWPEAEVRNKVLDRRSGGG